jgi:hypothetical protein
MPDKDRKYNEKHRTERREWSRKKKLCTTCGKIYSASNASTHRKSKYHNLVKHCREVIKNTIIT